MVGFLEEWNQLEIGDEIIFNNGSTLEKTKLVKAEVYYEQIRTYDIEVRDNHTFFANGILTHNSSQPAVGVAAAIKGALQFSGTATNGLRGRRYHWCIWKSNWFSCTSSHYSRCRWRL